MTDKPNFFDEPGLEDIGSADISAVSEPRLVSVRMFDREYQIKSDQPQLVELLADEINREAKKLQEQGPVQMGPGNFDWPVQVAFRLALSRFRAVEAYNTLKRQADAQAEKMSRRINSGMNDLETERLARRISADFDDEVLEGGRLSSSGAILGLSDTETGRLTQRITAGLDGLETDQLTRRFTNGLGNQVEAEAEKIVQRLMGGPKDEDE